MGRSAFKNLRILNGFIVVLICSTALSVILLPGANGYKQKIRPRSFFRRYHDSVVRLFSGGHLITSSLNSQGFHLDNITAEFTAFGRNFILELQLNSQLFSGAYVEKVFHSKEHSNSITFSPSKSNLGHCFYHGKVRHYPESDVAVSTCRGLQGYITDKHDVYHVQAISPQIVRVYRGADQNNLPFKCGTDTHEHSFQVQKSVAKRHRRSVRAPYDSNEKTRYVELYLVNDYRTYERQGRNISIVIQRSKDIANMVSSLYRQLNIYVALVGVEVWAGGDLVQVSTSADNTMESFLQYRMKRINPIHHNDNAQLITGVFFDHGVVGKAIKGPICTHRFSGGVNMDYGGSVSIVATTVAHEMGHNFGMEHDNDTQCSCAAEKCIMSATSGKKSPNKWSSCSHSALDEAFHLGMDYCLRNVPKTLFEGPVCGNGMTEEGEECDCGLPEACSNRCCNPKTCKLYPLAKCATGKCCDLKTCKPKPATTQCRRSIGECDLPEFCNGTSEFCPYDVFLHDGKECMSGQSYCYKGQCATHSDQCRLLWGESGRVSDPICFQQLNIRGDKKGNCGYNWTSDRYARCNREDVMCGLLHCVHLNEKLMFWRDRLALEKIASFLTRGNNQFVCRSAMLDVGMDMPDPGFVPDGAKCEHEKICIKQQCVPLAKLTVKACPLNCHGHGVCNSEGHCHCHHGYAPPLCDRPGYGGSLDSGPPSNEYGPSLPGTSTSPSYDHNLTPNDGNVSISTNSSDSGLLGANEGKLIAVLVVFLIVLPLIALAILIFIFRDRIQPYWNRFTSAFSHRAKLKTGASKPVSSTNSGSSAGSRSGSTWRRDAGSRAHGQGKINSQDNQFSNPLLSNQDNERNQNKRWNIVKRQEASPPLLPQAGANASKEPPPPKSVPKQPARPPAIVKPNSVGRAGGKKVRLSMPIQETEGPALLTNAAGLGDETTGPGKLSKRESFRGSQISGPVLVCTTNRNSLVLSDGNVDIIGPEANISRSSPSTSHDAGQVRRSQSERTELASIKSSVAKSASVLEPSGGFRSRPVPPLPTETEEEDSLPLYSNESTGVGDLWSEIQGSLSQGEDRLYNNLPIQETAPPCPPRPERYRPVSKPQNKSDSQRPQISLPPSVHIRPEKATAASIVEAGDKMPASISKVSTPSRPKTPTRIVNDKAANAKSSTTASKSSAPVLKSSISNELTRKILSRPDPSKQDSLSNSSKTPIVHHSPVVSTEKSVVNNLPQSVSVTNPKTTSSQNITPSVPKSSLSQTSGDKSSSSNHQDLLTISNSGKSSGPSTSVSVSSLKAKFSQTSTNQSNPVSVSKTGSSEGSKPVMAKAKVDSAANSKSNHEKPTKVKPVVSKATSGQKTTAGKGDAAFKKSNKMAEKPSSISKTTPKPTTRPSLQTKSALSERTTTQLKSKDRESVAPTKQSSSIAKTDEKKPVPAKRPLLPPKPGEPLSSETQEKNSSKTSASAPSSSSQPKRVQSFKI